MMPDTTSQPRSDPRAPRARPSVGLIVLIAALGGMVALAAWGAWASWRLAGDAPMSIHGWIAMGIAGLFSALLTGGLIRLAFYSARRGFDDDQGV